MSQSSLVTYTRFTKNYTPGNYKKTKITIHHMAAVLTAKQCVDGFMSPSRKASAQYCIGYDGSMGQSVREEDRAWTSSSFSNDKQAITIEVSNSKKGEPWPISDEAYTALILLCADICQRNGIEYVYYDGTKNGVLTEHRMFSATACPGTTIHNWLVSKRIENDINARLQQKVLDTKVLDTDGFDYSLVFDPTFYREKYPDLAQGGFISDNEVFFHFLVCGMKEARWAHKDFNVVKYRASFKDLDAAFDDDWEAYYRHYILCGKNEIEQGKRQPFM